MIKFVLYETSGFSFGPYSETPKLAKEDNFKMKVIIYDNETLSRYQFCRSPQSHIYIFFRDFSVVLQIKDILIHTSPSVLDQETVSDKE